MCVCVCASIESWATVLPPVQKREEQCPAVHGSPRTPASSGSPRGQWGEAWSNLTLIVSYPICTYINERRALAVVSHWLHTNLVS